MYSKNLDSPKRIRELLGCLEKSEFKNKLYFLTEKNMSYTKDCSERVLTLKFFDNKITPVFR